MKEKGFTLIELLVVIAIIGILAAIIAPNAFTAIEKSKIARIESDVRAIKNAALMCYGDTGRWPLDGISGDHDGDGIDDRCEGGDFLFDYSGFEGWDGPYLEKWGKVPWQKPANECPRYRDYLWDSDNTGDDNGNGIYPERSVIIFVPSSRRDEIELKVDRAMDDGDPTTGFIYNHVGLNCAFNWTVIEGQ